MNLVELSDIILKSRQRFDLLVDKLKVGSGISQDLEFSIAKVEAELLSFESTIKEINEPSNENVAPSKQSLLLASVLKLLPYYLLNFERVCLQCGVKVPGGDQAQIGALFKKNKEYTSTILGSLDGVG